jgi:hypothetical protein
MSYTRDFDAEFDFSKKSFKPSDYDNCRPTFYIEKVLNPVTGQIEEVEMVKVSQPNEQLNVWGGKVTQVHRERWPRQYEAFKKREVAPVNGIPLARWPEVESNIDLLELFKNCGLWTVQEMANMTDIACQKFHGGMTWRKRAQDYLTKIQGEDSKDTQIQELMKRLAALEQRGPASEVEAPKRRGRPPSVQAAA